jgi:hypothetical protein
MKRRDDGFFDILLECHPEVKEGVLHEMRDDNVVNIFATRILNALISAGLPAQECRKIYCGNQWIEIIKEENHADV